MGGIGLVPGKAVKQAVIKSDSGTATVETTDTEIEHRLGTTPTTLLLTPLTTGAAGYVSETARSATSITIRASASGVDCYWKVLG